MKGWCRGGGMQIGSITGKGRRKSYNGHKYIFEISGRGGPRKNLFVIGSFFTPRHFAVDLGTRESDSF